MAREVRRLSAKAVEKTKQPSYYCDGEGLYLQVRPTIAPRLLIALFVALPAPALAQDWKAAQSDYKIRHWAKPAQEKKLNADLPRAEGERFVRGVDAIVERIAALPAFKAPRDERCHQVQATYPFVQSGAPAPPAAEVVVTMYDWVRVSCLVNDLLAPAGFTLYLNQPEYAFPFPSRSDAIGKFYQWPGELPKQGVSRYENIVVVVRPEAPLLLPITKQRYAQYLIAAAEERVRDADARLASSAQFEAQVRNMPDIPTAAERYEKWRRDTKPQTLASIEQSTKTMRQAKQPEQAIKDWREGMEANLARQEKDFLAEIEREKKNPPKRRIEIPPSIRERGPQARQGHVDELDSLRAQLAALSPEQRRAPACSAPEVRGRGIGECATRRTLVEVNPDFFDKAKPRGEVQLVVLRNYKGFDAPNPPKGAHNDLVPLWQAVRDAGFLETLFP
jgi:hypothetical protein